MEYFGKKSSCRVTKGLEGEVGERTNNKGGGEGEEERILQQGGMVTQIDCAK